MNWLVRVTLAPHRETSPNPSHTSLTQLSFSFTQSPADNDDTAITPRSKIKKVTKQASTLDNRSFLVVAPEKTVEFHCEDHFERDLWVDAVQQAIDNLTTVISPNGQHHVAPDLEVGAAKIKTRPSSVLRGGTLIPTPPAISNLEFLSSLPVLYGTSEE